MCEHLCSISLHCFHCSKRKYYRGTKPRLEVHTLTGEGMVSEATDTSPKLASDVNLNTDLKTAAESKDD